MSNSPSNLLQRLQELKLWQQTHETILNKSGDSTGNIENSSVFRTIEGLSAFDSPLKDIDDIESKKIIPTKTFSQMIEDRLAQDPGPRQMMPKPKQPFLRKGSGLKRFRMSPQVVPQRKLAGKQMPVDKDKTPLRDPDFIVQPKGRWTKVINTDEVEDSRASQLTPIPPITTPGEQTLFEKALEKELRIFEALEKRVNNSSFCSTNSSVVQMFADSPQKSVVKSESSTKHVSWQPVDNNLKIEPKIDLPQLLLHLQKMAENNQITPNKSDSEDDKWSTTSASSSNISIATDDLETTIENKEVIENNTGEYVGNQLKYENELKEKIEECNRRIDEILYEKTALKELSQEIYNQKQIWDSDIREKQEEFEKQKVQLLTEVEEEKKKLAREKLAFQTYMKEIQNNPNRKERAEISDLKREIADLQETLKLKESKNGMTQARLRNQIKQLEKDNLGLKDEIEKLTRENAKLSAAQKIKRKSSETKILQEINRNISKLATKSQLETKEETNKNKSNDSVEFNDLEKQYKYLLGHHTLPSTSNLNDSSQIGRAETVLEDGSKEIRYKNGNIKTISPDGNNIIIKYYNGDIKQTSLIDGVIKYFYQDKNIWQTTYADGVEVIDFSDYQEKRYPDGKCEVYLQDGTVQTIIKNGTQFIKYPDNSILEINQDGTKILNLPNGQKEIQTKDHKRREYPDGTIKIIYSDNSQETRYANGRIRKKDADGNLVMDTQYL